MTEEKYGNIPRDEIPWFPKIDADLCTSCGACVRFCYKRVYQENDGKVEVSAPYECVVSCTGCVSQCPTGAISFPSLTELRDSLKALRARYG